MSDRELLEAWSQRQDEQAFAELSRRHAGLITGVARQRLGRGGQDVDEVQQAVLLVLARRAGSVVQHPNLPGWLHRTTEQISDTLKRGQQRRVRHERAAVAEAGASVVPSDPLAPAKVLLPELVADLAPAQRDVVEGVLAGKTVVATAQELGISEDAARKRLSYALGVLRRSYAKRGVRLGAGALAALCLAEAAAAEGVVAGAVGFGLASVSGWALSALAVGTATAATIAGVMLWPEPAASLPVEAAPAPQAAPPAGASAVQAAAVAVVPQPEPRLPRPGVHVYRQRLLAQQAFDPQGMTTPPERAVLWLGRAVHDVADYTWNTPAPTEPRLPEARFRIADLPRFLGDLDGERCWLGAPVVGQDLLLVAVWPVSLGIRQRAGLATDHGDVWWLSLGCGQRQQAMGLVQIYELGPAPATVKPLHIALRQQSEIAPGWMRSDGLLVASALVSAEAAPPLVDRPHRVEPGLVPALDPATSVEGPIPQQLEFIALPSTETIGLVAAARLGGQPPSWPATRLGGRVAEGLRGRTLADGTVVVVVATPALPYHADGVPVARYRPLRRSGTVVTVAVDVWLPPPVPAARQAHVALVLALPPLPGSERLQLDLRTYQAGEHGHRLDQPTLAIVDTLALPQAPDLAP